MHVPKGYTYFAMGFSVLVEMLNIKLRKNAQKAVHLRSRDYENLATEDEQMTWWLAAPAPRN